jgi:heat shock protein HslJ
MRPVFLILTCLLPLSACLGEETLRAYGGADKIWYLSKLNGAPFTSTATLTFPEAGRIAGQAPCNRYFGTMKARFPAFETGPVASTKRACPDLMAEGAFFTALRLARRAEVSTDRLILSDDTGPLLVFKSND